MARFRAGTSIHGGLVHMLLFRYFRVAGGGDARCGGVDIESFLLRKGGCYKYERKKPHRGKQREGEGLPSVVHRFPLCIVHKKLPVTRVHRSGHYTFRRYRSQFLQHKMFTKQEERGGLKLQSSPFRASDDSIRFT